IHVVEGLAVRWDLARRLYRRLAPGYEAGRRFLYFGEDHFEAALRPSDRVLDLGSGTGYLSRRLARRARKVVGLERERPMVREAVRRGGAVQYVVGDMARLPFKAGCFDRCVSLGAFHCAGPDPFFSEVCRVLRPGGEALVLAEVRVIPLLSPAAGLEATRKGLRRSGMDAGKEVRIGGIYRLFRASKR
ncbi:MAG: class I SAM-dependent methyltransferase, partial [bacterium]